MTLPLSVEFVYLLSGFALVSAFYVLAQPFIKSMIRAIITQSVLVGLTMFVLAYVFQSIDFVVLGILVIVLRGFLVSYLLERRLPRHDSLYREDTGGAPSTLLVALAFASGGIFILYFYVFGGLIPSATIGSNSIIVFPFVMFFVGAYLIISRKRTIAHVIGYVEQENGMVLMGSFILPVPFVIEMTVLLDVVAMVVISSLMVREKHTHVQMEELRG